MSISIITPVFNKADITQKFVTKLLPLLRDGDELIIVDNASTDNTLDTVATLRRVYKSNKLTIISNNRNYGFGTANNIGANISKCDILAFISNDVDILGPFLDDVENYLTQKPRTLLGARLITFNTGWNNFDKTGVIPYVEGWSMFIPRDYHFMIGGFDSNIFIDYEDVEYSFRAHQAGLGLAQIVLPLVHAHPGSSFSGLNRDRFAITLESQAYLCKKYGFTKIND